MASKTAFYLIIVLLLSVATSYVEHNFDETNIQQQLSQLGTNQKGEYNKTGTTSGSDQLDPTVLNKISAGKILLDTLFYPFYGLPVAFTQKTQLDPLENAMEILAALIRTIIGVVGYVLAYQLFINRKTD